MVEHTFHNRMVEGSSPSLANIFIFNFFGGLLRGLGGKEGVWGGFSPP